MMVYGGKFKRMRELWIKMKYAFYTPSETSLSSLLTLTKYVKYVHLLQQYIIHILSLNLHNTLHTVYFNFFFLISVFIPMLFCICL